MGRPSNQGVSDRNKLLPWGGTFACARAKVGTDSPEAALEVWHVSMSQRRDGPQPRWKQEAPKSCRHHGYGEGEGPYLS